MEGSSSQENLSESELSGSSSNEEEPVAAASQTKGKERMGGGQDGVTLVTEGDEIDETNSSILTFLRTFPRVLLRTALSKYVFIKKGGYIKATCTHTDVVNDHKAGRELFSPEWHRGAGGVSLLALRASNDTYWSVEKTPHLSFVSVATPRETELFAVELLHGGSGIALRTCLQTYVGLDPKKRLSAAGLVATATTAGDLETFYVSIKCGLLLAGSNLLVSATKLGRLSTDHRHKLHRWECFLIQATGNCCTIASSHKRYLTAETTGQISISSKVKGSQQLFTLVPSSQLLDWKYKIQAWYNCYLRCEAPEKTQSLFVADAKGEKDATSFQLMPLGVVAEELKKRSQTLSSSINALQTSIADEEAEQETENAEGEKESDQPQASLSRSDTALEKLTESLSTRSPSMMLRENLMPGEVVLMKIDQMAHIVCERAELGTIYVTNMHIIYNPQFVYRPNSGAEPEERESEKPTKRRTLSRRKLAKGWKVGLKFIDNIESTLEGKHFSINLYCKDYNVIQLSSLPGHTQTTESCQELVVKLQELCFQSEDYMPSAILKRSLVALGFSDDGWNLYDPAAELKRLGFDGTDDQWRMTDINNDYSLCKTYPRVLVVPADFTDEQLRAVAAYRSRGRVPSVVWRHPKTCAVLVRCSQPRRGLKMATCHDDENYVECVRHISQVYTKEKEPYIQFLDARPRFNAFANQLNGAGTEDMSNYKRCKRKFLGIGNIHVMRSAYAKVQKLALLASDPSKKNPLESVDFEKWLNEREETLTWLEFIALIISSAKQIVRLLERGTSIIFHCSDGWDRTAQVCGIAELQLDPYYRTKRGFAILIEKEWLSFGHKFEERMGHKGKGEKEKERSPIFFQFLECVYQMLRQFPHAFEFNERFLLDIQHATHSCLYGTFLYNSEYERLVEYQLPTKTLSIWSHLLPDKKYNNPIYDPKTTEILDPSSKNIKLWVKAHFPFLDIS